MMRLCVVLQGRKIAGRPYGGTWQTRRGAVDLRHGPRGLLTTWREERGGRREFDRFRLRLMWVDERGLIWPLRGRYKITRVVR